MKLGILKWLKNHLHRPKWRERDRQRRCWPRNTSIDILATARFRMCVNSILYVKSIGFSRFWPLGNRTNTQPVSISNTNADSVFDLASIEYCTAVTGFTRRVLGYIDLDLCNDLLHHICRHIWPNWRSRWSGQCLQVWHWKMQMLGTSNEMAVSSWLNLPLQLQHLYIQSISNHSVIITAIVTISTTTCSSDLDSLQFQLTCEIPRIRVKAQYRSTGVLILVKASGAGDYWGEYGK